MNGKSRLIKLVQTEMTSITIGDKDIMIAKTKNRSNTPTDKSKLSPNEINILTTQCCKFKIKSNKSTYINTHSNGV